VAQTRNPFDRVIRSFNAGYVDGLKSAGHTMNPNAPPLAGTITGDVLVAGGVLYDVRCLLAAMELELAMVHYMGKGLVDISNAVYAFQVEIGGR
jgi:hypothetical protein